MTKMQKKKDMISNFDLKINGILFGHETRVWRQEEWDLTPLYDKESQK